MHEESLNQLIDLAVVQINNGVTLKNVKRGITNNGTQEDLAEKIVRIAELQADENGYIL
jgi:hypothetical protein